MAGGKGTRTRARGSRKAAAVPEPARDIYQDLLEEATREEEAAEKAAASRQDSEGKVVKKRRVGGKIVISSTAGAAPSATTADVPNSSSPPPRQPSSSPAPEPALQTIDYNPEYSGSEGNDDDDDDTIFEDVEMHDDDEGEDGGGDNEARAAGTVLNTRLDLVLEADSKKSKPATARARATPVIRDKKLILGAHRLHLLCLLCHLSLRNHWCNDEEVQRALHARLPRSTRKKLADDPSGSQYTRDLLLLEGLHEAVDSFAQQFQRTARGTQRAWWDSPEEGDARPLSFHDLDLIISVEDFQRAAVSLKGSRDLGAQLFCALVRSCGLDARLVCSLQVLPINGLVKVGKQPAPPPPPRPFVRYQDDRIGMANGGNAGDAARYSPYSIPSETNNDYSTESIRASGVRRKLAALGGRSSLNQTPAPAASSTPPRARTTPERRTPSAPTFSPNRLRESAQPVYWVEVFSPAYQKWIAVDPIVTKTVGKPLALHPSLKDPQNSLCYVVGMEEDGAARDVTKRYTKLYNAKTRKLRIDAMAGSEGSKWWRKVMRLFRRPQELAAEKHIRDSIEDAELQRREIREGMPNSIEDFKGHPVYVLERHLRRNEIIHPKRQIGTTGGAKSVASKSKVTEPVFRRQDVHIVKSSDAWYRMGREIMVGEQPMKRVAPKRSRSESPQQAVGDGDSGKGLYAFFQTELYQAPPVMMGRVPRNAFGNLDVYVPSMVPPGAVHFLHKDTRHAAKLLGVDYVDAVTGFEFKGRQGTAVVKGAVVAAEHRAAITAVLEGFEDEKVDAAERQLAKLTLGLWRRFLAGLKVMQRVNAYASDDDDNDKNVGESGASDGEFEISEEDQGGFVGASAPSMRRKFKAPLEAGPRGDFTVVEGPKIEIPRPKSPPRQTRSNPIPVDDMDAAGGFLPDDDEDALFGKLDTDDGDNAGGFIIDDAPGPSDRSGDGHAKSNGLDSRHPTVQQSPSPEATIATNGEQNRDQTMSSIRTDDEAPVTLQRSNIDHTHEQERVETADEEKAEKAEQSDEGPRDADSLLSEDPEDADADPDWLA